MNIIKLTILQIYSSYYLKGRNWCGFLILVPYVYHQTSLYNKPQAAPEGIPYPSGGDKTIAYPKGYHFH